MMRKIRTLVVAPHPDDEVLGVGGTLLRRREEGAAIGWLIMTKVSVKSGWTLDKVEQRRSELKQITELFGFDSVFELDFPTTQLDIIPRADLVCAISDVIKSFEPSEIFIPHASDIHSDHRVTFEAVTSCTKWFRSPTVKRVLAYETLSETDFSMSRNQGFQPNVFVNIEGQLQEKLRALNVYSSELDEFPFPRSNEAITALAAFRGASSGFKAAEAFELLREIN